MIEEAGGNTVQDAVDAINPVTTLDQFLTRFQDTQKISLMDSVNTVQPIVIPSQGPLRGMGLDRVLLVYTLKPITQYLKLETLP